MPTSDANLALMRAAFAALQRRDLDACVGMLSEDFLIDVAGAPVKRGRGAWRRNAEVLFTAFPDVTFDVEDMFAAGDKVAVRVRLTGTHSGDFLGHPSTGRRIDYKSNELYRIVDGKIAAEWICSDTLSLMTQTGVMSEARLVNLWLSGYRVWFALVAGLAAGVGLALLAVAIFG